MLFPKKLGNGIKRLHHTGHLRIVNLSISCVKEIIYGPGIDNDITNIVNACEICLETNKSKNPLYRTTYQTLQGRK